jgi:hypothetical protein
MKAGELLIELRSRGVLIEPAGDRLKVDAPKGVITQELREALAACKSEVLAILAVDDHEIAWRVDAMLPQIPDKGPIPFLVARVDSQSQAGYCLSCGELLNGNDLYRCTLCSRAANKALELAMMKI